VVVDSTLARLGSRLPDDARRDFLIVQIEKSVVLKEDIAHYRRNKNSEQKDKVCTLKFLGECVDRHLQHVRDKEALANRERFI
jgi:hypothetical protein